jgi:hypothetical protein
MEKKEIWKDKRRASITNFACKSKLGNLFDIYFTDLL